MFSRGYFWPRWYSAFSALFNICAGEVLLLWGALPVWAALLLVFLGLCGLQAALRPRPRTKKPKGRQITVRRLDGATVTAWLDPDDAASIGRFLDAVRVPEPRAPRQEGQS